MNGDTNKRYTTVNCLLGTQQPTMCNEESHIRMRLNEINHRVQTFSIISFRVPLSEHKTCTRTTVRTQNMYMYHCQNTKHVHVPLSEHKTCTCTTVRTQNMYTYHCQNTKHVHLPLSEHKTCICTTVRTQNMYRYHCQNTKHIQVPLSHYKIYWPTIIYCK